MPNPHGTIASVLARLASATELIARANGSTNGAAVCLAPLADARVHIVHRTETVSAGKNWSALCRLATGTFTKDVCANDTFLPGELGLQLAVVLSNRKAVSSPHVDKSLTRAVESSSAATNFPVLPVCAIEAWQPSEQ